MRNNNKLIQNNIFFVLTFEVVHFLHRSRFSTELNRDLQVEFTDQFINLWQVLLLAELLTLVFLAEIIHHDPAHATNEDEVHWIWYEAMYSVEATVPQFPKNSEAFDSVF